MWNKLVKKLANYYASKAFCKVNATNKPQVMDMKFKVH